MTPIQRMIASSGQTIQISRISAIDSTHDGLSVIASSVPVLIQAYEPTRRVVRDSTMYKTARLYCDVTVDLAEEDKVFDGTYTYTVKGVLIRNQGVNQHIEALIDRAEETVDY